MVRALRRHWIASLFIFAFIVVAGSFVAYMPPDKYEASAIVLVQPNPEKANITPQIIGLMVPSMLAQLDSRSFRERALASVSSDIRSARVRISAVDSFGSGALNIRASSTQREAVAPWATAMAKQIIAEPVGQGVVVLSLLDEARPPAKPYAPSRKPVVFSSVVLGMIVATLGAIAMAAYRMRVDEVDEIRSRFGTTVLGEVPTFRGLSRQKSGAFVSGDAPPAVVEALQALRTNVEFLLAEKSARSVAVVSATSGEGKSTISVALSWALASVGIEVTAVDADLRRPVLHKHFEGKLTPGVSSVGKFQVESLLQSTALPSLTFLSAGLPDRHPAEILRSNLPGVLRALTDREKTVVIDCPPLVGLAETTFVTSLASSVILVVDRQTHDLVDVERALSLLHDHGADVLGVVINRTRRKLPKSDYYDTMVRRPQPRPSNGTNAPKRFPPPKSATKVAPVQELSNNPPSLGSQPAGKIEIDKGA